MYYVFSGYCSENKKENSVFAKRMTGKMVEKWLKLDFEVNDSLGAIG